MFTFIGLVACAHHVTTVVSVPVSVPAPTAAVVPWVMPDCATIQAELKPDQDFSGECLHDGHTEWFRGVPKPAELFFLLDEEKPLVDSCVARIAHMPAKDYEATVEIRAWQSESEDVQNGVYIKDSTDKDYDYQVNDCLDSHLKRLMLPRRPSLMTYTFIWHYKYAPVNPMAPDLPNIPGMDPPKVPQAYRGEPDISNGP